MALNKQIQFNLIQEEEEYQEEEDIEFVEDCYGNIIPIDDLSDYESGDEIIE